MSDVLERFHGRVPLPADDGRPLLVVHGNCQAESLRVLLGEVPGAAFRTVRVPPVHELVHDDLPALARLLAVTDVLVSQPVRPDFAGVPVGTAQVRRLLPATARVVLVPVLRWPALHPYSVLVRVPGLGEPPVVPYHDLRTLVRAATGRPPPRSASAAAYRAVRDAGVGELRRRSAEHDAVVADDLFLAAGREAALTMNHPGNTVLRGVAARVRERLGEPGEVPDPGRVLLRSVLAPVAADVLAALEVAGPALDHWRVEGADVPDDEVVAAQLAWYADHPEAVAAGLRRHAATLATLGLAA